MGFNLTGLFSYTEALTHYRIERSIIAMKQLTTYNRVAGYLNHIFDLLNQHYFSGELSRPTITIQSTPRAYGHFSLREDTWVSALGGTNP